MHQSEQVDGFMLKRGRLEAKKGKETRKEREDRD